MYIERTDNMKGLYAQPVTPVGKTLCLRPLVLTDSEALRPLTSGCCELSNPYPYRYN